MGQVLRVFTGTCDRCGIDSEYQIIDMTGDGERIYRQWLCPDEHRDTHVESVYPQFRRSNRDELG
jgi:hypothetical protein